MGKDKEHEEILNLEKIRVEEYDTKLDELKDSIGKLKKIKRRNKKIKELEREKEEILKRINKKYK